MPLGAIVRFALATSMRRGEILRMRGADVDEAERIVLIRNRKHPTDRDRVDESPLMPAHSLWPRWDALEIIKAQPKGDFLSSRTKATQSASFEKACEIAKLDGIVFHLLRHESLSRYAELRRFDLLRLQLMAGTGHPTPHALREVECARIGEGSRTASGGTGHSGQANGRTTRRPSLTKTRKELAPWLHEQNAPGRSAMAHSRNRGRPPTNAVTDGSRARANRARPLKRQRQARSPSRCRQVSSRGDESKILRQSGRSCIELLESGEPVSSETRQLVVMLLEELFQGRRLSKDQQASASTRSASIVEGFLYLKAHAPACARGARST